MKMNSCLEKTAVTCRYGTFFTLEIPAADMNSEKSKELLRSWSYDCWLYYDRKAATAFIEGKLQDAIVFWFNAFMEVDRTSLDDPRLTVTLENLIEVFIAIRDIEVAEEFATRNLTLNKVLFGDDHPNVMNCHSRLADIYYRRQKYTEALQEISEANRISKLLNAPTTAFGAQAAGIPTSHPYCSL